MRPGLLVLLLVLVGIAAWLVMDKAARRTSPASRSSAIAQADSEASIVLTDDSTSEAAAEVATPPTKEQKSASPLSRTATPSITALVRLEQAYAQGAACQIVRHTYYALCYDEKYEQPRWTVHILEGAQLARGRIRRTQDFRPDPHVPTGSAALEDYKRSGYDRGHLVPAGDFKWDSVGMTETFYLSNMSPQLHEFNAGIWEEVESTVRSWAQAKKCLVVYTGPVLDNPRDYIGPNKVAVPRAFYKVVYWLEDEKAPRAVAFLVPHAPSRRPPMDFLVSVDSVEKVTGIDFYPALPDPIEERVEARIERDFWRPPKRHKR
ncbi:MAG: DNA/RNA non-specific endonuclease [Bacteroidia bacterium]|nr:DNA/RNA non-specific endonuclease [Bacteroidia bacterium]GIV22485.1 MAG: hypothetical protein KatS3mg025_0144 [Bacteroidia bacterium]